MLLSELPAHLEREFTYPVDAETVVDRLGSVSVEAPNATDAVRLDAVLDPLGAASFDSAAGLYATIYGTLDERFVGRKYYDDRGGNPSGPAGGPRDEENVSF